LTQSLSAETGGVRIPSASGDGQNVRLPYLARLAGRDRDVEVVPVERFEPTSTGGFVAAGGGARFAIDAMWTPGEQHEAFERWDVRLAIEHHGPDPIDAGVIVALHLAPTADPAWLIPGLFYGENRVADCTRRYPRWVPVPTGDDDLAASRWSFRSDRAATPSVSAADGGVGATLATTERSKLGPTGIGFAGRDDATELLLTFPFREEPVVYDGFETARPADVRLYAWRPGERAELAFRVYLHDADRHAYAPVQRDLHAWLSRDAPLAPWGTVAETARLAAHGLTTWHYRPGPGVLYETAAFERDGDGSRDEPTDRRAMHVAWLSGAPAAFGLLAHGRRTGDDRAEGVGLRVLDEIATNLAPCGTFWGQWSASGGWGKGWTPGEDRLHARTLGEAAVFMGRALRLEPDRDQWREAVASNLRFVADRQRADGALPAQWHGTTGAVEAWQGSAGLAWLPALVEGAARDGDTSLLDIARRAGDFYAGQVEDEFLFGAPEDVDLAPTSEDGYVALMAYVALADAETDPALRDRWIGLARRAADWMLTFRYSYNVSFEPETLLGRYDYRSRGADQASPANQHLHAYGLIAAPEMVRLARLTGDDWYTERTRENVACFRQFVARRDGDFNARRGMTPERYYQTNCFGPKGAIGPLSHAWCLGLLLYACDAAADIPELAEDADGA
jgi:hypothetical protein